MTDLCWSWLGRIPYAEALERQRHWRSAVISGERPEVLWLLEHDPVITTGRRGVPDLPPAETLASKGIALHHTERGGLATYHGPGQLTVYAIVDCLSRGMGPKGAIHAMEQGVIDWLDSVGVDGTRRPGFPGVWVGTDKICAVGMHFRLGVSMHGIAINLTTDLAAFELITPCGITDGGITSLAQLGGTAPQPEDAAKQVGPLLIHNLHNPACTLARRSNQPG